jgi:hypothetical protein
MKKMKKKMMTHPGSSKLRQNLTVWESRHFCVFENRPSAILQFDRQLPTSQRADNVGNQVAAVPATLSISTHVLLNHACSH